MTRRRMVLVVVLSLLVPVLADATKVVLKGPVNSATMLTLNGAGRWRASPFSSTLYLALDYSYDGTNIALNSAVMFEKYTENGEKKYAKRTCTTNEVALVAVKGGGAGFSFHFQDEDTLETNVTLGVLSGAMSGNFVTSLSGAATCLSWDKPGGDLGDMYDTRFDLSRVTDLKTAADVEARLIYQGCTLATP